MFIPLLPLLLLLPLTFSLSPSFPRQKIALVTGANKGIGKEIARRLGNDSDFLTILAARDPELGRQAAQELLTENCNVVPLPMPLDLNDPSSLLQAARHVQDTFGVLDVLINNAAICFNDPTLYGKVEYTSFRNQANRTIQTNFFGTLQVTQVFLPLLKVSSSPRIINVASAAGRLTILRSTWLVEEFTSPQLTVSKLSEMMRQFVCSVQEGTHRQMGWPDTCYGVSKLGLIAWTRVMAREYPDMMINSVDPGYCRTDQNNCQGELDPAEGAYTPYLLAVMEREEEEEEEGEGEREILSGLHFFEEQEIPWSYQY